MVVGVLTQSKTSALGNKYMTAFFCLLLWVTLWDWGFGLHYCVVSGQARHINLLMMPTTLRVNICPYYHILFGIFPVWVKILGLGDFAFCILHYAFCF